MAVQHASQGFQIADAPAHFHIEESREKDCSYDVDNWSTLATLQYPGCSTERRSIKDG